MLDCGAVALAGVPVGRIEPVVIQMLQGCKRSRKRVQGVRSSHVRAMTGSSSSVYVCVCMCVSVSERCTKNGGSQIRFCGEDLIVLIWTAVARVSDVRTAESMMPALWFAARVIGSCGIGVRRAARRCPSTTGRRLGNDVSWAPEWPESVGQSTLQPDTHARILAATVDDVKRRGRRRIRRRIAPGS